MNILRALPPAAHGSAQHCARAKGQISTRRTLNQPGRAANLQWLYRAQPLAYYFALRGVLAGLNLRFYQFSHRFWQSDAHLLGCSHGTPQIRRSIGLNLCPFAGLVQPKTCPIKKPAYSPQKSTSPPKLAAGSGRLCGWRGGCRGRCRAVSRSASCRAVANRRYRDRHGPFQQSA